MSFEFSNHMEIKCNHRIQSKIYWNVLSNLGIEILTIGKNFSIETVELNISSKAEFIGEMRKLVPMSSALTQSQQRKPLNPLHFHYAFDAFSLPLYFFPLIVYSIEIIWHTESLLPRWATHQCVVVSGRQTDRLSSPIPQSKHHFQQFATTPFGQSWPRFHTQLQGSAGHQSFHPSHLPQYHSQPET